MRRRCAMWSSRAIFRAGQLQPHQEMRRLLASDLPRSIRQSYIQECGYSYEQERDDLEEAIVALHTALERALLPSRAPDDAGDATAPAELLPDAQAPLAA